MERIGDQGAKDEQITSVQVGQSQGFIESAEKRILSFTIPLRPQAKQRGIPVPDRSTRAGFRVITPPETRSFESTVGQLAWSAMRANGVAMIQQGVPVEMTVIFHIGLPKSLSNKERSARLNRPHLFDPDNTNMCKAIEDGCNKVVYHDDNQIWRHSIEKLWGEKDSIEVKFTW